MSKVLKILIKVSPFVLSILILVPPLIKLINNYLELGIRFQLLGLNLVSYCTHFFETEPSYPIQTIELLKTNNLSSESLNYLSLIPENIQLFFLRFGLGFRIIFSKGYLTYYLSKNLQFIYVISIILSCSFIFIPLYFIFVHYYFESSEFEYNEESNGVKRLNKFKDKLDPLFNKFKNYLQYLLQSKIFIFSIYLSIFLQFNGLYLLLDILNYYIYFITTFNFSSLYDAVIMIVIELLPVLVKVPKIFYLIIIYLIFNKWRYTVAENTLARHDALNCGFIKSTGVMIMINGAPGAGKTKLQTDMSITTEMMFRQQAHEIMNEVRNLFPHFRWDLFRRKLDYWIKTKKIKNLVDVEPLINEFIATTLCPSIYFTNDSWHIKNYKLEFDNGLYKENLFDDLIDYGKSYFVYTFSSPLLISNYPIRVDHHKYDNGHYINWDYNWFKKECEDFPDYHFSKVVDYDMMRLNKKKNLEDENGNIPIAYVFALTELGKERGNSLENQEIKKNDDKANQKNDGFTDYLRVGRHPATIRHRTFFKIFYDEQRASSCGIALSGITENVITIDKKLTKSKTAVPFIFIRLLINEVARSISSNFINRYEQVRNDDNLLYRYFKMRLQQSHRWYTRFCNNYGYDVVTFYLQNGTLEEQSKELDKVKYYLAYKKIYSNRYASDYLKTFFDEKGKKANKGILDLPSYQQMYPSWDDIIYQNSYFGDSLKKNLGEDSPHLGGDNDFKDLV